MLLVVTNIERHREVANKYKLRQPEFLKPCQRILDIVIGRATYLNFGLDFGHKLASFFSQVGQTALMVSCLRMHDLQTESFV